jgi:hypothetical protein
MKSRPRRHRFRREVPSPNAAFIDQAAIRPIPTNRDGLSHDAVLNWPRSINYGLGGANHIIIQYYLRTMDRPIRINSKQAAATSNQPTVGIRS